MDIFLPNKYQLDPAGARMPGHLLQGRVRGQRPQKRGPEASRNGPDFFQCDDGSAIISCNRVCTVKNFWRESCIAFELKTNIVIYLVNFICVSELGRANILTV